MVEALSKGVNNYMEKRATRREMPGILTKTWQSTYDLWRQEAKTRGFDLPEIRVPPLTAKAYNRAVKKGIRDINGKYNEATLVFYPGLKHDDLEKMFHNLSDWNQYRDKNSKDVIDVPGWYAVEAVFDTPNLNATVPELQKHFKSIGVVGMTERVHILFARHMKQTTGMFPDRYMDGVCRLVGTTNVDGEVVNQNFSLSGRINCLLHGGPMRRPNSERTDSWGARSMRLVQKAFPTDMVKR